MSPSFQVGKMVDVKYGIFGSIYGFRWMLNRQTKAPRKECRKSKRGVKPIT